MDLPDCPAVFIKPASTINDPLGTIPVSPACHDAQLDYEVELAIVLGRTVKDASLEEAASSILGYTIANDVTAREWQRRGGSQWSYSKGRLIAPGSSAFMADVMFQALMGSALSDRASCQPRRCRT